MGKYNLVAPCGDYCGGCGQYNGLIIETAKQISEFAALYRFEFRAGGAFDFEQFVKGLEWFIENAKCHGGENKGIETNTECDYTLYFSLFSFNLLLKIRRLFIIFSSI